MNVKRAKPSLMLWLAILLCQCVCTPASPGTVWTRVTENAGWSERCKDAGTGTLGVINTDQWVFGGSNLVDSTATLQNDVYRSADNGVSWSIVTLQAPWARRRSAAATSVVTSTTSTVTMFVVGGNVRGEVVNDIWSTNDGVSWMQVTSQAHWPARQGHALVTIASGTYSGTMVLFGGLNNIGDTTETFADIWMSSDAGVTWALANRVALRERRDGVSAIVVNDGTAVMVMGGRRFASDGGVIGYYNDVLMGDGTPTWSAWLVRTEQAAWSQRAGMGVACMQNCETVLVMGGVGLPEPDGDVWWSDDNGATWDLVQTMAPWGKRSWFSVRGTGTHVYVMGGMYTERTSESGGDRVRNSYNDVWAYDVEQDPQTAVATTAITTIATPVQSTPLPSSSTSSASALCADATCVDAHTVCVVTAGRATCPCDRLYDIDDENALAGSVQCTLVATTPAVMSMSIKQELDVMQDVSNQEMFVSSLSEIVATEGIRLPIPSIVVDNVVAGSTVISLRMYLHAWEQVYRDIGEMFVEQGSRGRLATDLGILSITVRDDTNGQSGLSLATARAASKAISGISAVVLGVTLLSSLLFSISAAMTLSTSNAAAVAATTTLMTATATAAAVFPLWNQLQFTALTGKFHNDVSGMAYAEFAHGFDWVALLAAPPGGKSEGGRCDDAQNVWLGTVFVILLIIVALSVVRILLLIAARSVLARKAGVTMMEFDFVMPPSLLFPRWECFVLLALLWGCSYAAGVALASGCGWIAGGVGLLAVVLVIAAKYTLTVFNIVILKQTLATWSSNGGSDAAAAATASASATKEGADVIATTAASNHPPVITMARFVSGIRSAVGHKPGAVLAAKAKWKYIASTAKTHRHHGHWEPCEGHEMALVTWLGPWLCDYRGDAIKDVSIVFAWYDLLVWKFITGLTIGIGGDGSVAVVTLFATIHALLLCITRPYNDRVANVIEILTSCFRWLCLAAAALAEGDSMTNGEAGLMMFATNVIAITLQLLPHCVATVASIVKIVKLFRRVIHGCGGGLAGVEMQTSAPINRVYVTAGQNSEARIREVPIDVVRSVEARSASRGPSPMASPSSTPRAKRLPLDHDLLHKALSLSNNGGTAGGTHPDSDLLSDNTASRGSPMSPMSPNDNGPGLESTEIDIQVEGKRDPGRDDNIRESGERSVVSGAGVLSGGLQPFGIPTLSQYSGSVTDNAATMDAADLATTMGETLDDKERTMPGALKSLTTREAEDERKKSSVSASEIITSTGSNNGEGSNNSSTHAIPTQPSPPFKRSGHYGKNKSPISPRLQRKMLPQHMPSPTSQRSTPPSRSSASPVSSATGADDEWQISAQPSKPIPPQRGVPSLATTDGGDFASGVPGNADAHAGEAPLRVKSSPEKGLDNWFSRDDSDSDETDD